MPRPQIDPEIKAKVKKWRRGGFIRHMPPRPPTAPPGKRPSVYHEAFLDLAYKFSLLAAQGPDLANLFEVTEDTIENWYRTKPGFRDAVVAGRSIADANVTKALYRRATGYSHPAVKIFYDRDTGEVVEVPYTEYYPPDPTSCIYWLRNRQRHLWADQTTNPNTMMNESSHLPQIIIAPVTVRATNVTIEPVQPVKKEPVTVDGTAEG